MISREEALGLIKKTSKVKKNGELSVERIEEEIERVSKNQPWFKDNFRKIEELGLKISEVLQLGIVR